MKIEKNGTGKMRDRAFMTSRECALFFSGMPLSYSYIRQKCRARNTAGVVAHLSSKRTCAGYQR